MIDLTDEAAFEAAQALCEAINVHLRKTGKRVVLAVNGKAVTDGDTANAAILALMRDEKYRGFVERNFQALALAAAIEADIEAFDAALEALGFVEADEDEDEEEDEEDSEADDEDEEAEEQPRMGRVVFRRS